MNYIVITLFQNLLNLVHLELVLSAISVGH